MSFPAATSSVEDKEEARKQAVAWQGEMEANTDCEKSKASEGDEDNAEAHDDNADE